jgi:hypothetical protein
MAFRIGSLAPILPDEIFASVLLRNAEQQGANIAMISPFTRGSSLRHACYLKSFSQDVPSKLTTPRNVLQNLCIYPFMAPFATPRERLKHLRWAVADEGDRGTSLLSRRGRPPLPTFLRLCPDCADEDRAEFGEPYFHRRHQLPGINVCLRHRLALVDSATDLRAFIFLSARLCAEPPNSPFKRKEVAVPQGLGEYIAVALDHLSTLDPFDLPKYDFKKIYLKLFAFGRPTQNKLQALLTEIENHYGKGLVPAFSWDTWKSPSLYHFLRVAKVSNTLPLIAHLVLLHYMGIAFPEALRLARGSSVWACPNKYCEDYQQLTLTEPKLIKTSLHMMCTTCDMKFSINGDTPIGDAPSQFRLIDPGPSFLASLKNEFKKGVNLAQASESSGIPEHLVVRIAHDAGIRESRRQRVESYYPGSSEPPAWYSNSYVFLVNSGGVDDIEVEVVPEPSTWAMMLGGLGLLLCWQRRKNRMG